MDKRALLAIPGRTDDYGQKQGKAGETEKGGVRWQTMYFVEFWEEE